MKDWNAISFYSWVYGEQKRFRGVRASSESIRNAANSMGKTIKNQQIEIGK